MDEERVILIKGDESKWYDQVIFIVKNDMTKCSVKLPLDLVFEAEKIINAYVPNTSREAAIIAKAIKPTGDIYIPKPAAAKSKKRLSKLKEDMSLNVIVLISCLVLVSIILWSFL